ncbi:hypothetical protein [Streptococcus suis]|uniref:Uncharacterized protein n=1 Tax=Streptococcus suis TaxID=1307 RepID=A0A0Z8DCC0_STRSU|nr:hypothetical protein [Streptococcus suis]CYU27983.1 Uncharacterised protein [Streptococcus suis]CYU40826.1 Uncharacterised protein [Streptococcus suis]
MIPKFRALKSMKGAGNMSTIKKWEKMTQKSDIKDLAKKLGV